MTQPDAMPVPRSMLWLEPFDDYHVCVTSHSPPYILRWNADSVVVGDTADRSVLRYDLHVT